MFGLVQSPLTLRGTLDAHLESKKGDNINEIAEIKKSLYADDFISGGINTTAVRRLKQLIINIFGVAQFILHKCHSNVPELEDDKTQRKPKHMQKLSWMLNVRKQKSWDLRGTKLPILWMLLFQIGS